MADGRIMSIHGRRAISAVLECLEKVPRAGPPFLHWFSGSVRDLDRAIKIGCWFSVRPAMLATEKGRRLAARMPRHRVLTESDGPFAHVNGRSIMPWDVEDATIRLAQIWNLSEGSASEVLQDNFRNLCLASPGSRF